jgi:DNA-binding transcriptional LysR family regulator
MLPLATALADTWARLAATATRPREPGLTVACGQEAAGGVVLAAATAFRKVHPGTPLRIAVVRGRQRIEGVAAGYYDLALVTTAKRDIEPIARRDVTVRSLPDDELVLACAAKSAWEPEFKKVTEVTAARLKDWPLVLPEADAAVRQAWEEKVGRQSVTLPAPAIEVGGWRVLMGYVLAGFGVGLLPTSVVMAANTGKPNLIARPLAGNIRPANQLRVVTLPAGENAALVKDFDDALGSSAGSAPAGGKQ